MQNLDFFKNKKVLITGHNGFKGAWLCKILTSLNADVTGFSLPCEKISLFLAAGCADDVKSVVGDIRDYDVLKRTFDEVKPEIVIHLAAQAIVSEGYKKPRYTYETNFLGTLNVLDCVNNTDFVKSLLIVTTDKVYEEKPQKSAYFEDNPLNGFDPYSNSKSCCELVTSCYVNSYLKAKNIPTSTVRCGNVIGGGDFAENRIIPDCYRAISADKPVILRNPHSVRPYQHVLEPLFAYLLVVQMQCENPEIAGCYNVAPPAVNCLATGELAKKFIGFWGKPCEIIEQSNPNFPYESDYLTLDSNKIKSILGWCNRLSVDDAVKLTADWYKSYLNNDNMKQITENQVSSYIKLLN